MAGPKLLGWHDRTHLIEQGISIASNGARWTGLEPAEYDQGQHDGIHEVLAVSTAGALIRRDIFEELGGFDLNLELFRDDVDFGWRARVAGHSVIAVSDAIGYHAQASSNERRSVDVEGALLHRPLLLDRRNAAYVLLANSSLFALPWLSLQLLSGAILRSIGYLFAKLPGYASDELLAIATLIIHPAELLEARKVRKQHRLVSSRVVKTFIPSRTSQLRASINRTANLLRSKILPDAKYQDSPVMSDLAIDEDEDLLTPIAHAPWRTIFYRPMIIAASILVIISIGWSRHRLGDLSGGALAQSPDSAQDLIKHYISSWHEVGMGSGQSTPAWVLLVGIASVFTFANPQILISLFFLLAPFLLLVSAHRYFKKYTENGWLSAGASLLYALSPIAIAAINAGRLGLLILLIALPFVIRQLQRWIEIEKWTWRGTFSHALFLGLLLLFNPSILLPYFFLIIKNLRTMRRIHSLSNGHQGVLHSFLSPSCSRRQTPLDCFDIPQDSSWKLVLQFQVGDQTWRSLQILGGRVHFHGGASVPFLHFSSSHTFQALQLVNLLCPESSSFSQVPSRVRSLFLAVAQR
jgi:hypothetical protein